MWAVQVLLKSVICMFDLNGIARQLHLSTDQIRLAAELLEQGHAPTFISRYRADETGSLSTKTLWRLKMFVDRNKRLQSARERTLKQLPKDVSLDGEAQKSLTNARTLVAIDSVLKSFRARRALEQSQEKDSSTGKLLEAMITYTGPAIEELALWAGQQIGSDAAAGDQALSQVSRLVSSLMQCDTALIARLRSAIQRKAFVRVEEAPVVVQKAAETTAQAKVEPTMAASDENSKDTPAGVSPMTEVSELTGQLEHTEGAHGAGEHTEVEHPEVLAAESSANEQAEVASDGDHEGEHDHSFSDSESHEDDDGEEAIEHGGEQASQSKTSSAKKGNSKLTPRQRRRRWLLMLLSPMKSINKPLNKLTAYQHLMLGRGVRSQLIRTPLSYDSAALAEMARDSFVDAQHMLAAWFTKTAAETLDAGLRSKLEAEAINEMEEEASEHLLEHATDELRTQLMRRPVRGHTIALIDTIGPKSVVMVIVDAVGNVLATDELPCSAQPEVVNQNVVKLGELIHKHRVTLVALTNGPARRFMVATLRELMVQSKGSNLRWTMSDRSAAEAFASGRIGLRELATYNRRERAAIWAARYLQDPLVELLKVDIGRLRLGSYQCELPKEPLKQLVVDTIVDCVCTRGIDTLHAAESELQYIPGVSTEQARQIVQLASSGKLTNRNDLKDSIEGWPETGRRQALGWLRVFGSSTPLDATLIHPEDYRLAERLIENTGLTAPPAAPPGWVNRWAALASSEAPGTGEAGSTNEDPAGLIAATSEAESEIDVASDSASTASDSTIAATADATENVSAESTSDEDAATEPTAELAASFAPEKSEAPVTARPAIAPEYPEEIHHQQTAPAAVDAEKLANQWQVGRAKLKTIATALQDPFADPRLEGPAVPLLVDLPTLESLQPGDCVWAIVVGVADFGAFVELAPNCNGLIHISRLSPNFIEDPHQAVQVGDLILTWVVEIDAKKHRASLTALSPSQRAEAAAAAEQRKAQAEQDRAHQRQQRGDRGPRRDGAPQGARDNRRNDSAQRSDQPAGGTASARPPRAGQQTGGRPPQRAGRDNRSGGNDRGGGRGQGRGRGDSGPRHNKSVSVTSKKPVAPISQAMKQGAEPLRSFSDLMQFYESKRTGDGPEEAASVETSNQPVLEKVVSTPIAEPAAVESQQPIDEPNEA
jgi:protein Tex